MRTDLLNGNPKYGYCDPNNTAPNPDAYCATYKAGYEAGWLAAELLYGNRIVYLMFLVGRGIFE
ncbi:MAG: hypothetical protein WA941_16770 [Nitrososphaeraceae archaeon]